MADKQRFHDMDWLRVLAFLLLMFYHVGMIFVGWDFHLMNHEKMVILQPVMIFMNQWRLPLLFAISGAGTWFALRRRSLGRYAGERTRRLFLPLAFGMLFVVPPQIYVEYVMNGQISPDYWAFQKSVFHFVPYPDGGMFSWHHLWFVVYLFVYSLAAIPIFGFLRTPRGENALARVRKYLAEHPGWLLALVIPLAAVNMGMNWRWPETHGLVDDPAALLRYFVFFWLGYLVMGDVPIREAVRKKRQVFIVVTALVFVLERLMVYNLSHDGLGFYLGYHWLRSCYSWFAILTIMGYAAQYLTRPSRFLRYANEAVYPYYILHQTVMLVLAFYVVPLSWPAWVKFVVIAVGMFAGTGLIYEGMIRRFNLIRPLFGLKMKAKPQNIGLGLKEGKQQVPWPTSNLQQGK